IIVNNSNKVIILHYEALSEQSLLEYIPGYSVLTDFDPEMAIIAVSGDNILFTFADGTTFTLTKIVNYLLEEGVPETNFSDIPSLNNLFDYIFDEDFMLDELNDIAPAANSENQTSHIFAQQREEVIENADIIAVKPRSIQTLENTEEVNIAVNPLPILKGKPIPQNLQNKPIDEKASANKIPGENFEGTTRKDVYNGSAGDDQIYGYEHNDTLSGDEGNDRILGGTGRDKLYGNSGSDTLSGEEGNDRLYGGSGQDTLNGGSGRDLLYGNAGQDILSGGLGNDLLRGGADNDQLNGNEGNDRLYGGDGNDTLTDTSGRNSLYGEDGNDQ
ncbi:calcium-binding protein, partial [Curvivirga aplysinae]|uniref:calcium-binding protein n=1 Tax=Curvivirga aplysinae TaxID=2529852 RepID=UPI0022A6FA6A